MHHASEICVAGSVPITVLAPAITPYIHYLLFCHRVSQTPATPGYLSQPAQMPRLPHSGTHAGVVARRPSCWLQPPRAGVLDYIVDGSSLEQEDNLLKVPPSPMRKQLVTHGAPGPDPRSCGAAAVVQRHVVVH